MKYRTLVTYLFFIMAFGLGVAILGIQTKESKPQESIDSTQGYFTAEPPPAWYHEKYYAPLTGDEVARIRYEYLQTTGGFNKLRARKSTTHLKKTSANKWQNIGPFGLSACPPPPGLRDDINLSGRIISLGQDYINDNVMYLGAASGGLWKSVDRGVSWHNILDDLAHPSVSTIATNPGKSGDVWIGAGHKGNGAAGPGAPSMGLVYHSADYGETWNMVSISSEFIGFVSKIIVRSATRVDLMVKFFVDHFHRKPIRQIFEIFDLAFFNQTLRRGVGFAVRSQEKRIAPRIGKLSGDFSVIQLKFQRGQRQPVILRRR